MPDVTNANLAAQIESFVASVAERDELFYEWSVGTVSGGPNGDGRYPLRDFTGHERLVPSPEKLAQIIAADRISGLLSFATWAELDAYAGEGLAAGVGAKVYADAGTHPDQVSTAAVANAGVYRFVAPDKWERIANLEAADAVAAVQPILAAAQSARDDATGKAAEAAAAVVAVGGAAALGAGRESLWPDPLFLDYEPLAPLVKERRASGPYPDAFALKAPAGYGGEASVEINLFGMGIRPGDQLRLSTEVAAASGTLSAVLFFFTRGGAYTASGAFNLAIVASAGADVPVLLATDTFTVPPTAATARLVYTGSASVDRFVHSLWMHEGANALPAKPIDRLTPPRLDPRLKDIEAQGMRKAGVALRRYTYATRTVTVEPASIQLQLAPNNDFVTGYAQVCTPDADDWNAVELEGVNWNPAVGPPVSIDVEVYAAAGGQEVSTSADVILLAVGSIDVDPATGGIGRTAIPLLDPVTGALKTLTAAEQLATVLVGYYGVQADGSLTLRLSPMYGDMPNKAATNGLVGGRGRYSGFNGPIAIRQVRLTGIKEMFEASPRFAASVGKSLDPQPEIIGLAPKHYAVQGRELNIYKDNIVLRDARDAGWEFIVTGGSRVGKHQDERFTYVPGAGGVTRTLTVNTFRGGTLTSTASTQIVTASPGAAAGTRNVLFFGDSQTENNGSWIYELAALSTVPGEVTQLNFIGTRNLAGPKHEALSGQSAGVHDHPSSPFWDGTKFSAAHYLTTTGQPDPDCVFFKFGPNDLNWANGVRSDAAAASVAQGMINAFETYIASFKLRSVAIKYAIVLPAPPTKGEDGQLGEAGAGRGSSFRLARSIKVLNAELVAAFKDREGEGIYIVPVNTAVDLTTGFPRNAPELRHARAASGDLVQRVSDGLHNNGGIGALQSADAGWAFIKCAL
jgi:hypothetical protein